MPFDFKRLFPHLLALGIFIVLSLVYFFPQLEGKVVPQGDMTVYYGMSQELREYQDRTGETTLWTNAMFGGMPTYQIQTVTEGNLLYQIDKVLRLGIDPPAGQFLVAMLGFYILLLLLGVNPWVSIAGSLLFGFTTNNLVLFEAGHVSKLKAIAYFPLVAAGIILAFRRRYLLGGIVFGLGLGLNLTANHVQMTYYLFLTLLIYGIAQLVFAIRQGALADFGKATAALVVGGLLAIGSTASNLLPTYEYSADTMRGEPILARDGGGEVQSSSETEGLAWDYAMSWSNGFIDLFASYIPGVAGGGSQEPVERSSAYGQALTRLGANLPEEFAAPLYWGALPFTSGPIYFGAAAVFLFVLGLFLVKGPVKWWLAGGVLLTLLLSMGKNLEAFNRFFFDFVPLYNKFRTPNSVLSVAAFLVPLLGLLAVHRIISGQVTREEIARALKLSAGITGGVALFFIVLGGSFFTFSSAGDAQTINQLLGGQAPADVSQQILSALQETRRGLMVDDALRSLLFVGLCSGLLYLFLKDKLSVTWLAVGLGAVALFDLWGVGKRYVGTDDFQPRRNYEAQFQPRPVDQQILEDPDPNYRVFDLSINTFNSSSSSYFHKTIGGNHAAKLQRYQDVIDRYLAQGNQPVLNMLNTRYFIVPGQDGQPVLQRNPNALGNAWLVDSIVTVATANAEIDAIGTIDPATTAVVHQEFQPAVQGFDPSGEGSITLSAYEPNHLVYQYNSPGEQLAVFSEIWYGPNKGWQVTIDGEPADPIRVNYLLRGLRVPAGEHTIEFRFDPAIYRAGVTISWIASSLLLLLLIGYIVWQWRRGGFTPPPAVDRQAAGPTTTTDPLGDRPAPTTRRPSASPKKRKK